MRGRCVPLRSVSVLLVVTLRWTCPGKNVSLPGMVEDVYIGGWVKRSRPKTVTF